MHGYPQQDEMRRSCCAEGVGLQDALTRPTWPAPPTGRRTMCKCGRRERRRHAMAGRAWKPVPGAEARE